MTTHQLGDIVRVRATGRVGEVVTISKDTSPPVTVQFRDPGARLAFYGTELTSEIYPINQGDRVRGTTLSSIVVEGLVTSIRGRGIRLRDDRSGNLYDFSAKELTVLSRADADRGDPSDPANRWVKSVVRAFNRNGYKIVKVSEPTGHFSFTNGKFTEDTGKPLVVITDEVKP